MKFSGKVDNGPVNKRLNFGGDALVRRALTEVCTVPVLLVISFIALKARSHRRDRTERN